MAEIRESLELCRQILKWWHIVITRHIRVVLCTWDLQSVHLGPSVAFTVIPVAIAQCTTLGITQALKCIIRRRLAKVDLEVEGGLQCDP